MSGTALAVDLSQHIFVAAPSEYGLASDYPKFLLAHIERAWAEVALTSPDPEICFRVDAALVSCGCEQPCVELRRYMYWFASGSDFDIETVPALIALFSSGPSGPAEHCMSLLLALDFERDCGLPRDAYIERLRAIVSQYLGT